MRRPERSPTEGILTFDVTSGSCIAVLSAHPDGRRGVGGTDRSPLWFRPSPGLGDAGPRNSPTRAERGGGTKWYRPSCRSADCGENVTCLRLTATARLPH